MKYLSATVMILVGPALAGCGYEPPQTGPVATVNFSIHSDYGMAQFNVMPTGPGPITDGVTAQTGLLGGDAQETTYVRAGPVPIAFSESIGTWRCSIQFGFTAVASETYNVSAGDVPPPPFPSGTGILGKIKRNSSPGYGALCKFHVTQKAGDGSQQPVTTWGWRHKL